MLSVVSSVKAEEVRSLRNVYNLSVSARTSSCELLALLGVELESIAPIPSSGHDFSHEIARLEDQLLERALVGELFLSGPLRLPILEEELHAIHELVLVVVESDPREARQLEGAKLGLETFILVPVKTSAVTDLSGGFHLEVPVVHLQLRLFLPLLCFQTECAVAACGGFAEECGLLSDALAVPDDQVEVPHFEFYQAE